VSVAKLWDDLWVGVISQSNLVIAGSLRNISKYGGPEVEGGVRNPRSKVNLDLWISLIPPQGGLDRRRRAKVLRQEGNSPDHTLRCLIAGK